MRHQDPLSLTRINFNHSMDKYSRMQKSLKWMVTPYESMVMDSMDTQFNLMHYNVCNYLFMLGLKFNHMNKTDPRRHDVVCNDATNFGH